MELFNTVHIISFLYLIQTASPTAENSQTNYTGTWKNSSTIPVMQDPLVENYTLNKPFVHTVKKDNNTTKGKKVEQDVLEVENVQSDPTKLPTMKMITNSQNVNNFDSEKNKKHPEQSVQGMLLNTTDGFRLRNFLHLEKRDNAMKGLLSSSFSATSHATDLLLNATDLLPHVTDLLPHVTDLLPHATDLLPHATDLLPHATDLLPHATDLLPHATDLLPHATDLLPHATDLLPHATDLLPHATDLLPHATDLLPHATNLLPHATDLLPHATDLFPHATDLLPHATDLLPHATDLFPVVMESSEDSADDHWALSVLVGRGGVRVCVDGKEVSGGGG